MQATNYESIKRKTLAYAIVMDIVKSALSQVGSINATSEKTGISNVVYDETVKAANLNKK